MIQKGTYLNIIDNSGAKRAMCIHIVSGYKHNFAAIGESIVITIKRLRSKRRISSKTRKGEIYKALIVRTKKNFFSLNGDSSVFFENSAVLLNKQNKFIGTRIFGSVPKFFRYTKYLKIAALSAGLNV